MSEITPQRVLEHGVRMLRNKSGETVGPWCIHCNAFMGEHSPFCPYAAIASLQAEVERFPMQDGPPITMRTAKVIYALYSDLFGTEQSLERLADRGGFGWAEVQTITKEFIRKRGRLAYADVLSKEGKT